MIRSLDDVVDDFYTDIIQQCYQLQLEYDRQYQPTSDVILTDEEEDAMVDEINNQRNDHLWSSAMNVNESDRPSLIQYQHVRNEDTDYYDAHYDGPRHTLKGGATISYDYHTAQTTTKDGLSYADGCVDIAYGYAICADSDYFCKARGRQLSSARLRNLTEMSGCVTIPLKPRLSPSDVRDYVGGFVRRLLQLLWDCQKGGK